MEKRDHGMGEWITALIFPDQIEERLKSHSRLPNKFIPSSLDFQHPWNILGLGLLLVILYQPNTLNNAAASISNILAGGSTTPAESGDDNGLPHAQCLEGYASINGLTLIKSNDWDR